MDAVVVPSSESDEKIDEPKIHAEHSMTKAMKPEVKNVKFSELFRFADSTDYTYMFVGTISSILNGLTLPAFSVLFGDLFAILGNPGADNFTSELTNKSLWLGFLGIIAIIVSWAQVSFWNWSAQSQLIRIRRSYLASLLKQDCSWYDTMEPGKLAGRLGADCKQVKEAINMNVGNLFNFASMFLGGIATGFYYGWKLTLVVLAFTPFLAATAAKFGEIIASDGTESRDAYSEAGAVADEVLCAVRTVTAFRQQNREVERYADGLNRAVKAGSRRGLVVGSSIGLMWGMMFVVYGGALWYGGYLISIGEYTPATVLSVFFSVLIGAFGVGQAGPSISAVAAGRASAYSLFEVIDRESAIDSSSSTGKKLDAIKGAIEFKGVKFEYPTRPDTAVLKGIDFTAKAGETVALVGESGSGKSTIAQLLSRFYDPTAGSIKVDDIDLKDANVMSLRSHIGVVSQQPQLFSGTISDNIRFGKMDATTDEIITAAKASNAHNFIDMLPDKYDTLVGGSGAEKLSGGEKQRIAIARAICSHPSILVLDEATSALDSKSERVVQEALNAVSRRCTTLVIAHRLSTIRDANCICVMNQGEIIERGTHDELIALNGSYSSLLHSQELSTDNNTLNASEVSSDSHQPSQSSQKNVDEVSAQKDTKLKQVVIESADETKEEIKLDKSRLWALGKEDWSYTAAGFVSAVLAGLIMPGFSFLISEMLSSFFEADVVTKARNWAFVFFALAIYQVTVVTTMTYMFAIAGENLTKRLRVMLFKSFLRQDMAFFDEPNHSPGMLSVKLCNDAEYVRGVTVDNSAVIVQSLTMLVAGNAIAFIYGWRLALVLFAMAPVLALAGMAQFAFMAGAKGKILFEDAVQLATEAIGNIRTVASLSAEQTIVFRFEEKMLPIMKADKKEAIGAGLSFGLSNGILFFAYAISFYYGGWLIREGLMTDVDSVLKVFFSIIMSCMGLGQVAQMAPNGKRAADAAINVLRMMDLRPTIDPMSQQGKQVKIADQSIVIDDVEFTYATRPDTTIFSQLHVECPAGKTLALVGQSGAGKSTIISLLERFYDPTNGRIVVGDMNITDINIDCLRSQIGLVAQEPVLFSGSVRDNICYGKPEASEDEVQNAAQRANVLEFVKRLPDGLNTLVGSKASQLSGGQRQRIAIARALLLNPSILLLDEATSALDNESEKLVQEALNELMQHRTSIVIAHRLSTIKHADMIAVVDEGNIKEQGTHTELMALQGAYYHYATLQDRTQA